MLNNEASNNHLPIDNWVARTYSNAHTYGSVCLALKHNLLSVLLFSYPLLCVSIDVCLSVCLYVCMYVLRIYACMRRY